MGIAGCKRQTMQISCEGEYVRYEASGVDLLSSGVIKKITAIPLETQRQSLIGILHQLYVADNGDYYIVTLKRYSNVLRFDAHGNFLNVIGRRGRGPQEFIEIADFSFDGMGNPIVYSDLDNTAYYFSPDGKFLKSVDLGTRFLRATYDRDNDHFLYLGFNNIVGKWRLQKVDNEGNVVQGYLENDYKVLMFGEATPVFSHHRDAVYLREAYNNVVYRLRGNEIEVAFRFDFGRYNIPQSFFRKKDAIEASESLVANDFMATRRFMQNDDYILFEAMIQKADNHDTPTVIMVHGIKNKKTDSWSWFEREIDSLSPDGDLITTSIQWLSSRNEIVCLVDPSKILEYRDHPLLANPEVIAGLTNNSNHVILLCEFE